MRSYDEEVVPALVARDLMTVALHLVEEFKEDLALIAMMDHEV